MTMTSATRAWLTCSLAFAGAAVALGTSVIQCGSPDAVPSADAGTDEPPTDGFIAPDSGDATADGQDLRDVSAPCDVVVPDGGVLSDWPGWRRLPQLSACCALDVPVDGGTGLPPLAWHSCGDASTGCLEMNLPANSASPAFFRYAEASRDATGLPALLHLRWALEGTHVSTQDAIYEVETGQPLAAWRTTDTFCFSKMDVVGRSATLFVSTWSTWDARLAHGDPATLMNAPTFELIGIARGAPQESATSETTYAFDFPLGGAVGRAKIGSGKYATSGSTPALLLELVEKDDVYAFSEQGKSGWSEEYRVDPDGSVTPFRVVSGRHVSGLRTDGTTMFWVESYGNPDPRGVPTMFDVYAAPYTSDSVTLAASARKVASIPSSGPPQVSIAFGGLYGVFNGVVVEVVRLSDGAVREVSLPPGNAFLELVLVTPSELWTVVNNGMALWRIPIGAW